MLSRIRSSVGQVFGRNRSSLNGEAYIMSLSPAAWYRYGVGITSSGGFVSQWEDQSGNARHLLQATGTNQPALEVDNTITFDGVDNFMRASFTLNQPCTSYVVFKPITAVNIGRVLGGASSGSSFAFLRWNAAATDLGLDGGTFVGSLSTGVGSWLIDCSVVNSSSSSHSRGNGIGSTVTTSTNIPGGLTLCANQASTPANFSNTSIREVILFPTAHSEQERSSIMKYLSVSL